MPSEKGRPRKQKSAPASGDAGADLLFQVGGWTILFHPLILEQIERLVTAGRGERARRAAGDPDGPSTKLLAAIRHLIFQEVPAEPSRPKYRHGGTLAPDLKYWLRAKFGNGRFRLFFRYRTDARLLVFAWVNDSETLRTYGSRTDAYAVFRRMLGDGNPPDDWDALVKAASDAAVLRRASELLGREDQDLRSE